MTRNDKSNYFKSPRNTNTDTMDSTIQDFSLNQMKLSAKNETLFSSKRRSNYTESG